ncbi:MAG: NADH:ubiquinone reductase (Na(+)-transporting) subunit C [Dysgonamonadaceae bacterium]|jgi:Na+-transporting NADH:ubiquinone oxidoreductase subunit C|nr:NADH:ubiquinone reductase (Na(+)-transporting) subunit C [Dysgonamonadaceae bacterium]MDD3308875.1 NADH:ubiquinone reductase (Na(+)-transporting) subunit C [Dysgonamonadaceae bacterium]MDD3900407.1 NADH:ubiquinone reductase (Na(+)-transporting) subunit C [Dysgonamonadaceae bacterium]MDD4398231.1 NADH:ubiquinone reductase (Na(+)-transporting) subunit C [Dysgonamonadaceae bacterium]MEA5080717.1 NADH:ubiquinone reductase (Na(+)-transporting) subunit C [Dysgonamonadaceae bacterium]
MNKESGVYTIAYASIMVIIVALLLSFTHQSLSDKQTTNVNRDKMQQILRSLKIDAPAHEAVEKYNSLITDAYLINEDGVKIEGTEGVTPEDPAFSTNISDAAKVGLPVFEAEVEGSKKYIIPLSGSGLWGAIWGYLAVDEDGNTVYGSEFGHASETPGLGAEIVEYQFRAQFEGKHLFKNGEFTSIAVIKAGTTDSKRDYVDGISGGTITSKGVNNMLLESAGLYKNFLINLSKSQK